MHVGEAQRELRLAFLGGFVGQAVSAVLWVVSDALAVWGTPRAAIWFLVLTGFFIFPVEERAEGAAQP